MKKQKSNLPKCFLITSIGLPNSVERNRVNQWIKLIYSPVVKEKYELIRSDFISVPGVITKQIIDYIIDADLVIIDFTPDKDKQISNPNVMYEAAIRHIAQKPVIQIAPYNLQLPFDIKDFRCILYNPELLDYPKKLKSDLGKAISDISAPGYKPPDIIGKTFDLERIVSDPEKFIQLIKEKLFPDRRFIRIEDSPTLSTTTTTSSITAGTISYGSISGSNWHAGSLTNNDNICPNCGGICTEIYTAGTSFYSNNNRQFKCNVCGNIFSK